VFGGAENVVQGLRLAKALSEENAVAEIDFSNAFNTVERSVIEKQVSHYFPQLETWFKLCIMCNIFCFFFILKARLTNTIFSNIFFSLSDRSNTFDFISITSGSCLLELYSSPPPEPEPEPELDSSSGCFAFRMN